MLRRDLQIAADVVRHQRLDIGRALHREIEAHARADQDLLHAAHAARTLVELDQRAVVGVEVLADVGIETGSTAADRLGLRALAAEPPHVGGRSAEVRDHAGEAAVRIPDRLDLADDRIFRAALHHPPLVRGDRAERAAAEAAAHDRQGMADHLPRRNLVAVVGRVRRAGIGEVVDAVELLGGEGFGRRRHPDHPVAVALDQRAAVERAALLVDDPRRVGIHRLVVDHRLVGRQFDGEGNVLRQILRFGFVGEAGFVLHRPAFRHAMGRHGDAAHVAEVGGRALGLGIAMRDLDAGALGVAVDQHVGLGIEKRRAAHLVGPIVVVREAAQARLDAADQHRHVLVGLAAALRIHQHRAIRALAALVVGRVAVVGADAAVRGVAVDHAVHVPGGDAVEQVGLAELAEVVRPRPVGLGDDADAEALRLQHPADHRRAERRVVDVGVARDDDHVAGIPAERGHLLAAHRQERRPPEAVRPILAIREQCFFRHPETSFQIPNHK